MAIIYNGAEVQPFAANVQETDFSKVTARPEFVLEGKKFYNETGQLQTGTASLKIDGESGGESGGGAEH